MELVQYVRDRNGHPVGAVVALSANQIGWSLTNKLDRWDREKALMIARRRAVATNKTGGFRDSVLLPGADGKGGVPHTVQRTFEEMCNRAMRYFKAPTKEV